MEDKQMSDQTDSLPESTSELLQRRDQRSVEELLRRYRPLMRAIVAGEIDPALRAKVDASDLVQDACVEVTKSIDKIQSNRSPQFLAFLRQVVVNKLQDVRRRFLLSKKRNARRETKVTRNSLGNLEDSHIASQEPIDLLINDELLERTRIVMSTLPLEIKKLLHMRFIQGMTYSEIGERLNRTEDDVRMLIKRWLVRMRSELRSGSSS